MRAGRSRKLEKVAEHANSGGLEGNRRTYMCPVCRTVTDTPLRRGRGAIEVALYVFYIIPGVIYSVWRRRRDPDKCANCGYYPITPIDVPVAVIPSAREERACPWCAEAILVQAIVCKHCGRDVGPPQR